MQPFMLPADWPNLLLWTGVLAVAALIADRVASGLLQRVFGRVAARTRSSWDDRIAERKVVQRLAHVVPALVVYLGIGPALGVTPAGVADAPGELLSTVWTIVRRVAAAYIAFAVVRAFAALLDSVSDIYQESYAEAKSRPIKGYLQVVSLVAWLAAAVVIVSVLVGRSPVVFLSGLGALAAVLMLVFRDTILSLVASVQIASNDMIRIGDWLSIPQAQSDGEVIDIALHTVKVQNWDKTISTIPTSKFITESFKNWRGMSESGGRRIKRSLRLDMNSVRFLRDDEIEELSRRELLQGYMGDALDTIARYNAAKEAGNPGVIPEIRRLTNLGTFRVYVQKYLEAHPKTHKEMTLLARQLAPGPEGVPIEIYCFSNDTAWANYEGFQADIFDHLIAVLPEFGLMAYQSPAGSDFARVIAGGS
ncbi:MAG: mechanosensitive ion channel [Gemmatimonadota bacterium]|nr:mechanosensitive ion channel [Gemmatimonadota bacterium]